MVILGIETSCDETALSLIDIEVSKKTTLFEMKILANNVLSQIELHRQYGGVFPNLAKREHAKNLVPLFKKTLEESSFRNPKHEIRNPKQIPNSKSEILNVTRYTLHAILEREPELLKQFLEFIPATEKPPIDLIAVTAGPGLEPALWVGINFAKALSVAWNIPVVATNHMEGHILVALLQSGEESTKSQARNPKQIQETTSYKLQAPPFPALALLISGGHTELVLMKDWLQYEIVGRTRDDAIGEAFDKVARILGLPYPGGPEISALAELARKSPNYELGIRNYELQLPRPMLKSDNLDFSFSGLKTAVLYLVKKLEKKTDYGNSPVSINPRSFSVNQRLQSLIAREFEDAVTEVITEKVKKAIELHSVKTLILGGGVVANKNIREAFAKLAGELDIALKLPAIDHATDNALMIAIAGYFNRANTLSETTGLLELKADGNLSFARAE